MRTSTIRTGGLAIAAAAALALGACGTDDSTDSSGASSASAMSSTQSMSPSGDMTSMNSSSMKPSSDMAADGAMANLVGSGCAAYAEQNPEGPGSVDGMAKEPVATAASNNPMLTKLTAAVSGKVNPDVNLVDTLNGGEFTVFAPVDKAFDAVDGATMNELGTNADMLTKLLSHHVIEGRIAPDEIVGTHTTLAGDDLTVSGTGDDLKVGNASVVCGGVETANAVVYLVDGVLMPTM